MLERLNDAVDYVHEIVKDEGPFDAVFGFSEGASVAAAYLQAYSSEMQDNLVIAFAVFVCAAVVPPGLTSKNDEEEATLGPLLVSRGLAVPSVHIIGMKDLCFPQSEELLKSCKGNGSNTDAALRCSQPGFVQSVYFLGGHEVPIYPAAVGEMRIVIENAARVAFSSR
ncbi:serine hydrolase FSH [Clohesyomyces aquaticus]|uniref:Serine hydrolase FSH n=1 Tax=Clohesyomyces aquaticus TaxID=1231657 RepID=A0A1Y1YEZ2_9PLEO|nr:serine hydrolase FSH [Clohesyomyces aquaticus]